MNRETILPYLASGLISEGVHPENENIRIYNYTLRCQYDQAWDDVTMVCRGLILNVKTNEVVARPFPKFFNYGELIAKGIEIPPEKPIASEKFDGSLGILYWLNGRLWIATRGSFVSEQAQWATDWYRREVGQQPESGLTHLFEIIYPENRIVVNYQFSGLVHLATLDTQTGRTIRYQWERPIRDARSRYEDQPLSVLTNLNIKNAEGFVLFFPRANMRVKIKFFDYMRLHRLLTGMSAITIWEMLRDEQSFDDVIQNVPDEFYAWVQVVKSELMGKFCLIEGKALDAAHSVRHLPTRKEQATIIKGTEYPGIAFSMLDGKDYSDAIWRLIRPQGQQVFKVDIDV
jgi:hypothetical protein